MRSFLISIVFISALTSCEKEIPLDKEVKEPKIVVNGIFSANETIRVHLSESRDILYEGFLPDLTTGTVQLFDADNVLLGEFIHEAYGMYVLENVIPESGKIYHLKVSAPGYNSVTASSETPSIIAISQIDTVRAGDRMKYEITFQDDVNQQNFYELKMINLTYYFDEEMGEYYPSVSPYFCSNETIIQNSSGQTEGEYCSTSMLFSDASFNGQNFSFSASNYFYQDSTFVAITLSSVSNDYYKYKISLAKYQETQGSPFAQPVQVYSNIENGFGIFGGYSSYSDTLFVE